LPAAREAQNRPCPLGEEESYSMKSAAIFGKLDPAVQPTALFVEKSVHLGAYLAQLIIHSCIIYFRAGETGQK
jgi:hypothetical protein